MELGRRGGRAPMACGAKCGEILGEMFFVPATWQHSEVAGS